MAHLDYSEKINVWTDRGTEAGESALYKPYS